MALGDSFRDASGGTTRGGAEEERAARRAEGRWRGLNRVPFRDLEPNEQAEYLEMAKIYEPIRNARQQSPREKIMEDVRERPTENELKRRYGAYNQSTGEKLVRNLDLLGQKLHLIKPTAQDKKTRKEDWLQDNTTRWKIEQAKKEAKEVGAIQTAITEGMEEGGGKKYQLAQEAQMQREQMKLQKEQMKFEAAMTKQALDIENKKMALQEKAMRMQSRHSQGRPQSYEQPSPVPRFAPQFSPSAGLERTQFGGGDNRSGVDWSRFVKSDPMAGFGKIQNRQGGSKIDFSRFVNSDPTAGLGKMWANNNQKMRR